ncbi:hypothetical protein BDA96_03G112500 [Sorghum bicolor]|uniref:Uncharacterized protein n=2 Tax=Sorghum bicolor TaxID=4558 RepID=A0A921ULX1_SORBI|nr:hypothetical protein BDA96_03G112500 [Sorghum bicolor]OQU86568.1 hypothetical protein SORBI_3003G108050 [Sorghum bicolor]
MAFASHGTPIPPGVLCISGRHMMFMFMRDHIRSRPCCLQHLQKMDSERSSRKDTACGNADINSSILVVHALQFATLLVPLLDSFTWIRRQTNTKVSI